MELYLPSQTRVLFRQADDGLHVTFDTEKTEWLSDNEFVNNEKHREFTVENGRLYEQGRELDCSDYANGIIEILGCLLDVTESGLPGGLFFDALIEDLIEEGSLSWIPAGHYYFDGSSFMVFSTKGLLEKHAQIEEELYDQIEVERLEYTFPCSGSECDVRTRFRAALF